MCVVVEGAAGVATLKKRVWIFSEDAAGVKHTTLIAQILAS